MVVSGTFGTARGGLQAPPMAVVVSVTTKVDIDTDTAPIAEIFSLTVWVTVMVGPDSFAVTVEVVIGVVFPCAVKEVVRDFVWATVLVSEVVSVSVRVDDSCAVFVAADPPSTATTE